MPFHLDTAIFNPSLYKTVRALWFADVPLNAATAPQPAMKRWFLNGGTDEGAKFDQACRDNFQSALDSVGPSKFTIPSARTYAEEQSVSQQIAQPFLSQIENTTEPEGPATTALSLVLLFDQMPRNIFRQDQKLIYAHYDRIARAIVYAMMALPETQRWDLSSRYRYAPQYRQWFYLPMMHSEHMEDHKKIVELMASQKQELADRENEEAAKGLDNNIGFEKKHYDIIEKFGRYPYRNDHLDREWTVEERQWLKEGGETFTS